MRRLLPVNYGSIGSGWEPSRSFGQSGEVFRRGGDKPDAAVFQRFQVRDGGVEELGVGIGRHEGKMGARVGSFKGKGIRRFRRRTQIG